MDGNFILCLSKKLLIVYRQASAARVKVAKSSDAAQKGKVISQSKLIMHIEVGPKFDFVASTTRLIS